MQQFIPPVHFPVFAPVSVFPQGEKFDPVPFAPVESLKTNQSCIAFATFKK